MYIEKGLSTERKLASRSDHIDILFAFISKDSSSI